MNKKDCSKTGSDLPPLRENPFAVANVIEFVSSFLIFVVILAAFFTGLSLVNSPASVQDLSLRTKAERLSTLLISSSGGLDDRGTIVENWEDYPVVNPVIGSETVNILDNLVYGGFAYQNKMGILDSEKTDFVRGLSLLEQNNLYKAFKRVFNIPDDQNFQVVMYTMDNEELYLSWGGDDTLALSKNSFLRYAVIRTGAQSENYREVRVVVTFFEGGVDTSG